jgi:ribosomal protein S18 acetylase RimI-like enzyme
MRLATPSDLPVITALTEAAYVQYLPILGEPPVPVTEDYAPRIVQGEVWMLERGGKTAGLIVLERHPTHAEIFNVAVDPAFHGQGLGRALLDFAVETTRAWGLPLLRLYTNAKMERNVAIYAAYGFRETGRRPNPKRPQFTIVDMEMAV